MKSRANGTSGMTLAEVMIAMMFVSMTICAVYTGIVQAERLNYGAAQHSVALGRCMERLEQMRGAPFDYVNSTNFAVESTTLTHLGGTARVPLVAAA